MDLREWMICHHERDFGSFERRDDPPADASDRHDPGDAADVDADD